MNTLDFTAEEQSLIAIYAEPTCSTTAATGFVPAGEDEPDNAA